RGPGRARCRGEASPPATVARGPCSEAEGPWSGSGRPRPCVTLLVVCQTWIIPATVAFTVDRPSSAKPAAFPRSHALRGNAVFDALRRPVRTGPRSGQDGIPTQSV